MTKYLWIIILLGALLLLAALFFLIRWIIIQTIDKRIERFQSDLISKQVQEIQNMYRQIRGWRHDYRNHIQNMRLQLNAKNYGALDAYLEELAGDLDSVDTTVKTGNVMADAILNSKLTEARRVEIPLHVKAAVPSGVPFSDVELCSLVGNLLDNAIEANLSVPKENRFLRILISGYKGQFYCSVQNASGRLRRNGTTYLSTKPHGDHGYGLFRIDRIIKKYGGFVNRQSEEGVFATEITVPLKKKSAK